MFRRSAFPIFDFPTARTSRSMCTSYHVASAAACSSSIPTTTSATSPPSRKSSSPFLPSHRLAHKPQMTRRPALPRAGNLEPSKFIDPRGAKMKFQHRIYSDVTFAPSDVVAPFDGQLDVWRHMIMCPQTNAAEKFAQHRGVAAKWDVIVPLLESLREAGRVNRFKVVNPNLSLRDIPSQSGAKFFEQHADESNGGGQSVESSSSSTAANHHLLMLLPIGHRVTPEAVTKQFLIELNVRLPILERSLEASASPLLVARLCGMLHYFDFDVPSTADFAQSSQGLLDSRLRLRALIVAALRQSEVQLALDETEQQKMLATASVEKIELRKRRKLVLESSSTSVLFDFMSRNKNAFLDGKNLGNESLVYEKFVASYLSSGKSSDASTSLTLEEKSTLESSLNSMFNIDVEKETPRVWNWAKDGHDMFQHQLELENGDVRKLSTISNAESVRKPVQWLPDGKLCEEPKSARHYDRLVDQRSEKKLELE